VTVIPYSTRVPVAARLVAPVSFTLGPYTIPYTIVSQFVVSVPRNPRTVRSLCAAILRLKTAIASNSLAIAHTWPEERSGS